MLARCDSGGPRRVLVLGAGVSGVAAARLLSARGVEVTLVDAARDASVARRVAPLERQGIAVRLGVARLAAAAFDLAVASPGIASAAPWFEQLQRRGVPIISELELGWVHCPWPLLAITGSNGKSTLVKLCVEALRQAGRRAVPAGNFGVPLCDVVRRGGALDWVVVEVSSFQLETVREFRPRVAVLLNVHPNHLDRHGSWRGYVAAKARLFARQHAGDTAIVPEALPAAMAGRVPRQATVRRFGISLCADYRYARGRVWFAGRRPPVSFRGTWFENEILGLTAAAAVAAVEACGARAAAVAQAARQFEPLPHRMQRIATVDGVTYVDDSKATNLAALVAGVTMAGRPVRLIAGGILKERNLAVAKKILATRVRRVYIIGRDSQIMADAWGRLVSCVQCTDLEAAVWRARKEATSGEVILLSPGCASFDQFKNFEDRGRRFQEIVRRIQRGTVQ